MPTLDLARDAAKFLERLPAKQFRQVVVRVLELMREPRPPDSQQLRGYPFFRIDVGEYRVIYDIDGAMVRILVIGKRHGVVLTPYDPDLAAVVEQNRRYMRRHQNALRKLAKR